MKTTKRAYTVQVHKQESLVTLNEDSGLRFPKLWLANGTI